MPLYPSLECRLKSQHDAIPQIIINKNEEFLKENFIPGKWSIHEQIVHLAKYQPVFLDRMKRILNEEEPVFESYTADQDKEFSIWLTWDINKLIEQMKTDRQIIFDLISSLSEDQLKRNGKHLKYGRLTIEQWAEFFLLHEAHHIMAIFQMVNHTN